MAEQKSKADLLLLLRCSPQFKWPLFPNLKMPRLKKSEADVSQRGGNVLIDPDGIVQMHHVGAGPAARPGGEIILKIIKDWPQHAKIQTP